MKIKVGLILLVVTQKSIGRLKLIIMKGFYLFFINLVLLALEVLLSLGKENLIPLIEEVVMKYQLLEIIIKVHYLLYI